MPLKPAPPAPPPPPPLASALRAEPEACAETRARARHYGPASIDTLASLALPEGRASPANYILKRAERHIFPGRPAHVGIIADVRIAKMCNLIIGKCFDSKHNTDRVRVKRSINRVWPTLYRHALGCKLRLTRALRGF